MDEIKPELPERLSKVVWSKWKRINLRLQEQLKDVSFYDGTTKSRKEAINWILKNASEVEGIRIYSNNLIKTLNTDQIYQVKFENGHVFIVLSDNKVDIIPMGVVEW
jgi:hypothetical protein